MATDSDVQVQTTRQGDTVHELDVEVAPKLVARAFDKAYQELAREVRVKGFRPGKAPRSVLERLYGSSIGEQIEHRLVADTLPSAVEQSGLEPVAEPAIESQPPQAGAGFVYKARIEVRPQIELPDLAGLPAKKPRVDVSDADVDGELERLQQQQAVLLEESEGTEGAPGHVLKVDFVGRVAGEPFEGGTGQGVDVELGAGRFIPGFEEQLEGATAGSDCEVRVTFPEDYGASELAAKEAVFAVHVVSVRRREVPALDDEFAKDLGEFDSLDALRQRIHGDLLAGRDREAQGELRRTLMDSLIERCSFEVPAGMVDRRLEGELRSAHDRLHEQLDHDTLHAQLERWREEWRDRAERQVRESLLLDAVASAEGLEASPEDIEARLEEMAEQQGIPAARMRQVLGPEQIDRALEGQIVDEKAVEFLAARAKVEEIADT